MINEINIPPYRFEKKLGSGAMGTVYLVTDTMLGRKVAIKLMTEQLAEHDEYRYRFLNEARNIASVSHPNIILIHEVNVRDSNYYIAMEFASGGTLKERIEQGLSAQKALEILRQLASALECAHRKSIIHRDIKPANILFRQDGTAVLADFGIAKNLEIDLHLTRTGMALGTPDYMSPEQTDGQPLDARSDLYSLGVVFCEMLTRKIPDRNPAKDRIVRFAFLASPPRLPDALASCQPIIDRLMAQNPKRRYQNAAELIGDIDNLRVDRPKQKPLVRRASLSAGLIAVALLVYFKEELCCHWQPIPVEVFYYYRPTGQEDLWVLGNGATLRSGDRYKIQFTAREDSYVYIFQIDSGQTIYQLYPTHDYATMKIASTQPAETGNTYFIPSKHESFELDRQVGEERIYLLAYRQPNTVLEEHYRKLKGARENEDDEHVSELHKQLVKILEKGGCNETHILAFQHI